MDNSFSFEAASIDPLKTAGFIFQNICTTSCISFFFDEEWSTGAENKLIVSIHQVCLCSAIEHKLL